ncbi:MAG: hypothetical protein Q7S40_23440 [Opitutaceae bacterium]|nr:hypothetical protein [Opitutaceae bacterium]
MPAMPEVMARGVPEPLWKFALESCGIPSGAVLMLPGNKLPEPARQLLVHHRDMTSTLATHHGSALRVEILHQHDVGEVYLREVFLRTIAGDRIVEYGIIAIVLEQFSAPQQAAIRAGRTPLGGVLHRFKIPFESSPIGFFSVAAARLPETRRLGFNGSPCHGRFNRISKPTGEPLAWIMEILPPA